MPVYDRSMPLGIPGGITRRANSITEAVLMGASCAVGTPVTLNNTGKAVPATSAAIHGFVVRAYPSQSASNGPGAAEVEAGSVQDILRSGYIAVQLAAAETGKAVRGTQLKLVTTAGKSFVVGDLSLSEGTKIPGALCMGEADGNGVVEISFGI